jgi:DNA-binding CsgD family transcriptional regulator
MQRSRLLSPKYLWFVGSLLAMMVSQAAYAQNSFSYYKPYLHNRDSVFNFAEVVMILSYNGDSATAFKILDSATRHAQQIDDIVLEKDVALIHASLKDWHTPQRYRALHTILQLKQWTADNHNDYLWLRACNILARFYYFNEQYDLAFEQYLEEWPKLQAIPDSLFPEKKKNIQFIGNAFYAFGEYRKSIYFLLESLKVRTSSTNSIDNLTVLNTLGMCYRQLNMYDSSNYYFKAVSGQDDCTMIWKRIADGNLGENYVNQGLYSQAIPLLQEEFAGTYGIGDRGLTVHAAMYLAETGFRTGNLTEATRHTKFAQQFLEATKNKAGHSLEPYWRFYHLFSLLSRLYAAEGKLQLASIYADSAAAAKDSITRQFSALNLLRAQQKNDRQLHEQNLGKLRQKKIRERNIMLSVGVFACFTTLWLYGRQRRRHRYQQLIKDMELQKVRKDMENANAQLLEFKRHITEKNSLLVKLETKLGDSNSEVIKELHRSSILTNEEWERFRHLFEKVHDGYLQDLKLKIPNISPAEMRFMALARLGFSNKEMAASLGVSVEAIRSVWHRFRRKLALPDDTSLESFVQSI